MGPPILFLELPREEWPAGELMYTMLPSLDGPVQELRKAKSLLDTVPPKPWGLLPFDHAQRAMAWTEIALSHGVIALTNFLEIKRTLRDPILKGCRTLERVVDTSALDAADALYESYFPGARSIRAALVHPGRLFRNPEEKDKNSIYGAIIRASYPTPNSINVVVGNAVHQFSLTEQTIARLTEVRDAIFRALEPASRLTLDLHQQRIAKGEPPPL